MKRFLAWIAGGLALYRLLRRRRLSPAVSRSLESSLDPRAAALRAKLDDVTAAPVEPEVSAETPTAEAEEQLTEEPAMEQSVRTAEPADASNPDDRRRSVQEEARAAIEQMRGRS